jgi:transketolase
VAAADELSSQGVKVSVVSMPNAGLFLQQDAEYRESVLPAAAKARVVVEAGVSAGWASFAGDRGRIIGIDRFGASAPARELFEHYGLTVENVSQAVRDSLTASE